jgi:hypothetical protein
LLGAVAADAVPTERGDWLPTRPERDAGQRKALGPEARLDLADCGPTPLLRHPGLEAFLSVPWTTESPLHFLYSSITLLTFTHSLSSTALLNLLDVRPTALRYHVGAAGGAGPPGSSFDILALAVR